MSLWMQSASIDCDEVLLDLLLLLIVRDAAPPGGDPRAAPGPGAEEAIEFEIGAAPVALVAVEAELDRSVVFAAAVVLPVAVVVDATVADVSCCCCCCCCCCCWICCCC